MKLRKVILLLVLVAILLIAFMQGKKYKLPDQKEINRRVNYLRRITDTTTSAQYEVDKVSQINPEFKIFSYSFTCYAITNLVIKKVINKEIAIIIIDNCIKNTLRSEVSFLYNFDINNPSIDSLEEISVLYAGHLNLMIGCYKLISNNDKYANINSEITNNLIHRYNKSRSHNLESYIGNIWLPDNAVGIASLKLFSNNYNSSCDSVCHNWVKEVKNNYTNPETGLLYSTIDKETAKPLEETRGSMLGWSIMFIYQFEKDFAIELYKKYEEHFSSNFLIYQLFKERKGNYSTSDGDIDSGPLFLGYSIPANTFALSNAILSNDLVTARRIERMINTGAKRQIKDNEFKYKVRFIDLEVSPMAEAIILNSMSIERWIK